MLGRLSLKGVYKSDEDNILEDFYMPALSVACSYDRAVGFFSAATISYAAQAISTFVKHDGRMRLILGAFADAADIEAVQKGLDARAVSERIGQEFLREIDRVDDDLFRDRFEALAWLVAKGRLDIKVALRPKGMYHDKVGIISDENGDSVVFSGSANESLHALLPTHNYESIDVFPSWRPELEGYHRPHRESFERLWSNTSRNTAVVDVPAAVREQLLTVGERIEVPPDPDRELAIVRRIAAQKFGEGVGGAPRVPTLVGGVPFKIRDHQREALRAWQLTADYQGILDLATGAGKTITAAYAVTQMAKAIRGLTVIIAVPYQNLADQWCDNLALFNIRPLRCYVSKSAWLGELQSLIRHAFGSRSHAADHGSRSCAATASTIEWEFDGDDEVLDDTTWEVPLEGGALRKIDGGKGTRLNAKARKAKASAAAATAGAAKGGLVSEGHSTSPEVRSTSPEGADPTATGEGGNPGGAASTAPSGTERATTGSGKARAQRKRRQPLDCMTLLKLVRSQAAPPAATQVATLLLLANAVARSGHEFSDVLAILRRPKPIIAITGTVPGFEAAFLDLLKCGFVLPGSSSFLSGYDLRSINEYRRTDGTSRSLVLFRGRESAEDGDLVTRQVSLAVQNAYPILAVADEADRLPTALLDAADLNLVCNPVTAGLVVQIMKVVLGEAESLPGVWAHSSMIEGSELLTIADLGLAIRPGMSCERSLALLRSLIRRARKARDEKTASASTAGKAASSSSHTVPGKRGKIGTGSTIIEPEPIDQADTAARPPLRAETLAGYGEATNWALALKTDLQLWKEGRLEWSQMSTRLLLAGPPGTGKTTFARALANTLQLKLLATSVGTWLEPGYLGDVLARMAAAFAEAEAQAPCILFIDEIDGIGRRGSGNRNYDDYWISVVNRALELMDGAVKSQGVIIVGATNHPEVIDKALLRSGRLETRIDIPLPDVDALVGILRHHLNEDLDSVIASAPAEFRKQADQAGADPVIPDAAAEPALHDASPNEALDQDSSDQPDPGGPNATPERDGREEPPKTAEGPRQPATSTTDRAEVRQSVRHAAGGASSW